MKENIVLTKSKVFAIRIVNLYKYLTAEKKEYVLSKQLLRSGTSIGANIHEGDVSISKAEFVLKLNIALKEANESLYWLELLHETEYLSNTQFESLDHDCRELLKLLISIIKSAKNNV